MIAFAREVESDKHGIICAFHFREGMDPVALEYATLPQWPADAPASAFVWVHLNLSNVAAETWLRQHAELGEDFFRALHSGSRSTRIEREGLALFAVINDITFQFDFEPSDVATLWGVARRHLIVTARRSPLRAVDDLRLAVKGGLRIESPVALLEQLLKYQADTLLRIVRQAGDKVDDLEDDLLADRWSDHGARLARLRRTTVRLQRLLASDPSALLRLIHDPPAWVSARDIERLEQAHDDSNLALRDVASLQERMKLLQDEASSRVAVEDNRSLFVLTVVTVMALPINLTSGMMGMNVGGVPLAQHPYGFWWVLLALGTTTGVLVWLVVRRWRGRRRG